MSPGVVLLLILIIIIIAAVVVYYLYKGYSLGKSPNTKDYLAQFEQPSHWGASSPGPSSPRNRCNLYTFPGTMEGKTAYPGAPTLNSFILDTLTPETPSGCYDVDQIIAAQNQHTCIGPTGAAGPTGPNVSACFLDNGSVAPVGATGAYYSQYTGGSLCSGASQNRSCPGALSVVMLNFFPTQGQYSCVYSYAKGPTGASETTNPTRPVGPTGPTEVYVTESCDISSPSQLFRITRINPGDDPTQLKPSQGQNGIFAQILHRQSGLCLDASKVPITGPIGPADAFGATGASVHGFLTQLTSCNQTPAFPSNPGYGYNWLALPSLTGVIGGPTGPTGPTGPVGPVVTTPQQIVYIGNIDVTTIPLGNSNAILTWLVSNNIMSLADIGGRLAVAPVATYLNSPQTAQFVNYAIYNIVTSLPACSQGVQPCLNL